MLAAQIFTHLQSADFYQQLHAQAVAQVGPGLKNQRWLDLGCGPGLVTRLAAAQGYQALGIDNNAAMIRAAMNHAQRTKSSAQFQLGNLDSLKDQQVEVVSAASFLAVMPQPEQVLAQLWQAVQPAGKLLIIEPTELMQITQAHQLIKQGRVGGQGQYWLYLWARARQGRAVDAQMYQAIQPRSIQQTKLLHGLVDSWLLTK